MPTRVRLWPINSPFTPQPTPVSYSDNDSGYDSQKIILAVKKMIQIVCCSCTQRKLKEERVDFYVEKRFYQNIDRISVTPCPRHPYFKERIGSRFTRILCKCLELQKGRCNNCRKICFNLNFLAEKVKLGHYFDVPSMVDIAPIKQYLDNIKSMLFFYFCRGCFKVNCSLDHPKYISLIKKKLPYGFDV